jgi:hypothetical protein
VITRPQLVASAGGWIVEQLGGNRLAILLVLQFLRPLLWCGRIVGKPMFRLARYAYGKTTA